MYKALITDKFRDKKGNITNYLVRYEDGSTVNIEVSELKQMILNRQIEIINMQLTKDNRLISKNSISENTIEEACNILARNGVKVAYITNRNAIGLPVVSGQVMTDVERKNCTCSVVIGTDKIQLETGSIELYPMENDIVVHVLSLRCKNNGVISIGLFKNRENVERLMKESAWVIFGNTFKKADTPEKLANNIMKRLKLHKIDEELLNF